MSKFYGKAYRYKDKVIGVCDAPCEGRFIVGHATTRGRRMKAISIMFRSVEAAQQSLDKFAADYGLTEVRA